ALVELQPQRALPLVFLLFGRLFLLAQHLILLDPVLLVLFSVLHDGPDPASDQRRHLEHLHPGVDPELSRLSILLRVGARVRRRRRGWRVLGLGGWRRGVADRNGRREWWDRGPRRLGV